MGQAEISGFFDEPTNTVSYLVVDPTTRRAAIVDGVLDYDPKSGRVGHKAADRLLDAVHAGGLTVQWILETHCHADHLSAAAYLKAKTGASTATGAEIGGLQRRFGALFNVTDVSGTGREFDRLLADSESFALGELQIEVLHAPGHTPACICYRVGDAAFVGDTLFMPDYGTARCDFPGGDARQLYRSFRRLLDLPPQTRLFTCHDYKAPGRDKFAWETTVAEQRASNLHIHDGVGEDEFVAMRTKRDATLSTPVLFLPSIQVNIRAGQLPPAEANGTAYFKIPISVAS